MCIEEIEEAYILMATAGKIVVDDPEYYFLFMNYNSKLSQFY